MRQPARHSRGQVSYYKGLAAEDAVCRHLEARGCQVVDRRWRGAAGEIDLILRDGGQLVFVEVKTSRNHDTAALHLRPTQVKRLVQSATAYLVDQPNGQLTDMRIDLALVDSAGCVVIHENAITEY